MGTTADAILDRAQALAQSRGFNGFSFRDLATGVGIRSASVHHHFASKEVLGATLAGRYTDRLLEELGPGGPPTRTAELVDRYVDVFRRTLADGGRMCLYGMLAAEVDSLPAAMRAEVARFVEANVGWLTAALDADGASARHGDLARAIFAALEGAMLVARGSGDAGAYGRTVQAYRAAGLLPAA